MNTSFKSIPVVFFAAVFLFFSCKKDDSALSKPTATPSIFEQVQGKWNVSVAISDRSSEVSSKNQVLPYVTSVEFVSDSTYILVFNYQQAFVGTFSIKDSASFEFSDFGKIKNIKVSEDSLSFTTSYDDLPIKVKAGRAPKITIADRKKVLFKTWSITNELDGNRYYEGTQIAPGSIKMQFTSSGTLLLKQPGSSPSAKNWKWHPDNSDAIVFYAGKEANNDYYFKIAELSNTRLKYHVATLRPVYDNNYR